ncbi:MAG: type II toxin-antitoxin system HicB family antitoxin [Candidatus Magnetobacterium sp. LHC-1]|nr:type II toxin-antitoxin system HicB family antitoxin [Nitrospirota bacterium]
MRKVIIYPGQDGYCVTECPSLPGCISQGQTRQDASENIGEAIALYIEVLREDERNVLEDQLEVLTV